MGPSESASRAISAKGAPKRHNSGLRCLGTFVGALLAAPVPAWAVNWDYVPAITTGATYDTNVLYTAPEFERSAAGLFVDGRLELRGETEMNQLSLLPRIRSTWYPGANNSDLNYTDLYLTASEAYTGTRDQFSATAEVDRTSTRTSEFQPAVPDNPDQPPPAGSGRIVNVNEFRTIYEFAPTWRHIWSELTTLEWSASYADVKYSQALGSGRFDYRNVDSNVSLSHTLTTKTLVKIGGVGSLFHTAETFTNLGATSTVDNNTVQAGVNGTLQYSFSVTLDVGATLGWNQSNINVGSDRDLSSGLPCLDPAQLPTHVQVRCHTESSQNSLTGQIFLRKRSESTTANVTLSRGLYPSSEGYTVTQTGLSAFVIRNVSARLGASAGITASRQASVGGFATRRTDYANGQLGLSWRIRDQWTLAGSYQYIFNRQSGQTFLGPGRLQPFSDNTRNQLISIQLQWQGLGRHQ